MPSGIRRRGLRVKKLLWIVIVAGLGYFVWHKIAGVGAPIVIEKPVYGEMRATATVQDREIEMAMFAKMTDRADCEARARVVWSDAMQACPSCSLSPAKCRDDLPERYARLFKDTPIPSTYLSLSAGNS